MRRVALIVSIVCALALASTANAGNTKTVNVFIVVPAGSYASNVTPQQAADIVNGWLGQATDPPCVGSTGCTTEAWLRAVTGKTITYIVRTVYVAQTIQQLAGSTPDQCGSYGIGSTYTRVLDAINAATGYKAQGQRTIKIVLGAGGTASHIFLPGTTSNGSQKAGGVATLGDWGIEEQAGVPQPCIPAWDCPLRGWGHELMGALGAYCTPTSNNSCFDTDDNVYNGDPLTAGEVSNLLRYSGNWLH